MNTTLTGAEKDLQKMLENPKKVGKNESVSSVPANPKDSNLTMIVPNSIMNHLDTLDSISIITDENE